MKTFTININNELQNIEITVKNGAQFTRSIIAGDYKVFSFTTNEKDLKRIKKFAIKNGNDNNSNFGKWYAHCNQFSMDLFVDYSGGLRLNTYRPYGTTTKPY
jgi:hypothetical protein